MAEQRMLAPNTTIVALLRSAVVNPLAPTLAEIQAGLNISCAIVEGYTLNPTDSSTDDTRSICDGGNIETITGPNYEGELTFFEEGVLTDNSSVYKQAVDFFAQPVRWIAVKRVGRPSTAAFATGQVISTFSFESDYPQRIDGGVETPHQVTVPMFPDGEIVMNRTL